MMSLQNSTSFNMEDGGEKMFFSIAASMLMIAGPILTFEDVLQTTTIFNMDDGRKNVFP